MRALVFVHRWLGVLLCLFFAMWFASGMIMMYVPFPALAASDRLAESPPLRAAALRVPLSELLDVADAGPIDGIRLRTLGARPILVVEAQGARTRAYFADDAKLVPKFTAAGAIEVAEHFAHRPASGVTGPFDFDQWVVHQAFDRLRPYYRVNIADGEGTQLYVSQLTGEIVQRTRHRERLLNYFGAVVHWIYPTVIRKNWALWDGLVWWLSLIGAGLAVLGVVLGVVRLRDAWLRGKRGLASPFIGWLRWHHVLGLVAGAFVTTWIVSGWLSMDHGRLFAVPEPTAEQVGAFRGLSLREAATRVSPAALVAIDGAREASIAAVASRPMLTAIYADGSRKLFALVDGQLVEHELDPGEIERAIAAAWPGSSIIGSVAVGRADAYGHLREGDLPPHTLRTALADPAATWIHVDLETGAIVSVMDRGRRLYRWLFNGLHSLDVPGLADRRPWWDAIMLALLATGLLFSATGVVLGWRRAIASLRRSQR